MSSAESRLVTYTIQRLSAGGAVISSKVFLRLLDSDSSWYDLRPKGFHSRSPLLLCWSAPRASSLPLASTMSRVKVAAP